MLYIFYTKARIKYNICMVGNHQVEKKTTRDPSLLSCIIVYIHTLLQETKQSERFGLS